jgi:hypothetical protein
MRCFHRIGLRITWLVLLARIGVGADDVVIDPARAKSEPGEKVVWYDVRDLGVEGKGWRETKAYFDRLPAKAEGVVPDAVWGLSRQSAGLCVRFVTDATTIQARWTVTSNRLAMPHMAATGVSGLDLYVKTPQGRWHWLAVGQPREPLTNTATLVSGIPEGKRQYLLYLPLYNGVSALDLGIPRDRMLARPELSGTAAGKPIVFYGTSITQGGCASRPGMVHTAILGRRFDRPVYNLGFSGSGRMDSELASLLAELDPVVYVLDCLPNMIASVVEKRVEPFVKTLRAAHPGTPILLAEDRTYANAFLVPSQQERNRSSRAALKKAYERLKAEGIRELYYLEGDPQVGGDGEGTVDSSHPTDLGFSRMAEVFGAALEPILRSQ